MRHQLLPKLISLQIIRVCFDVERVVGHREDPEISILPILLTRNFSYNFFLDRQLTRKHMLQLQLHTVVSEGMLIVNLKRPQWQLPLYSLNPAVPSIWYFVL